MALWIKGTKEHGIGCRYVCVIQCASSRYSGPPYTLWHDTAGHNAIAHQLKGKGGLTDHVGEVWDIAFSPQGTQLAFASWDGTVRLWNVDARTCSFVLVGHSRNVYSVAYSPKGDQVASGGQDRIPWSKRFLGKYTVTLSLTRVSVSLQRSWMAWSGSLCLP